MRYLGFVADIEIDDDPSELDFEETDYQEVDIALISEDRIRIEWMEGDDSFAVTIFGPHDGDGAEFADGKFECSYGSWEGRRNTVQSENGTVTANYIADDENAPLTTLELFWIDVNWKTHYTSGRLLFEIQQVEQ